ncbi:MAG: HD domain-containing protein [Peptostreptococcaceae bacterium]|nr:HD domain-containing protein [Peptostreptococcaceae bacterium]
MSYITEDVRDALFIEYETPEHIIGHCEEVAIVSKLIAKSLNKVGYSINIDLLYGASSVHDLVRLRERHDLECAKILREKGYLEESELVKKHMRYSPFNKIDDVDEQDLLCLADRLVLEDEYAGLEKRMEYIVAKVKDKKDIVDIILGKKTETKELIDGIEKKIGIKLDELCEK